MTIAVSLYGRLSSSSTEIAEEYSLTTLLFVQCVLRQSNLALAVWSSKGWNQVALQALVNGLPPGLSETVTHEDRLLEMSDSSGLSRAQIAVIISQCHGPFLMHLHSHDCVQVLSSQTAMYGLLGFKRKEAFLMREVLAVLLDMIVVGREENKIQGRMSHNVSESSLGPSPLSTASPNVGIRAHEGNQ